MSEPRSTPLAARQASLGASFTDFGGWSMPVRYTSDLAEHHAVRTAAGLFDISHMAEFRVEGADAAAYLDAALAGRLSTLAVGRAKYSLLLAPDGGIIDDLIVYRLSTDAFLIVANAGNRAPVAETLAARTQGYEGVGVTDVSDDYALLALQGPVAAEVLRGVAGLRDIAPGVEDLRYYAWAAARFAGTEVLILRTGYTGEDGFELLAPASIAVPLWDEVLAAGASHGLVPAGLAARDTLRLEAGMPLYGHELSRATLPVQAGLGRVVDEDKKSFVGQGAVAAPDAPVLVGLVAEGRRAGRAGYAVLDSEGARVGEITSGALSPTLGHPIAMAYVAPAVSASGTGLFLDVRGTRIPTTVTALPFYRRMK
ncbi:glycine cleavage system aminomethyltransferase GcvT [Microbacterium sp.]|uniref:glycine cleavage system aminomethyltransferase GcvT n=1 Tax=Microbacterium sp. TaxID=51671 RepID=UPI0025E4CBEA|nr:glycine cleavage system aminomethyltransferase GcvT [Microbacterium sp.]